MQRTSFKYIVVLSLMLTSLALFSQDDPLQVLQSKFGEFKRRDLQEKLFVHTDKEFYLAGEIVWFKIYYVDAQFHKPFDLSKVAYVELLNKDNKAVQQAKVSLKSGEDNGSFQLPLSLSSGNYIMRAYTTWMKNSGPDVFFEKQVTIVNTFKDLDKEQSSPLPPWHADFFPEGGNLVKGIQSKVAFKVTDIYGRGADARGVIVNDKNDTVVSFGTLRFGVGNFMFTPVEGHSYKASIMLPDGTVINKDLPAAYDQGFVLGISTNDTSHIDVSVTTNLKDSGHGQSVFLFVQSGTELRLAEKISLNNGKATISIRKDKLGQGVNRLTLFNADKQPVCERLYFIRPSQNMIITCKADKDKYLLRSKVNLSVLANNLTGGSVQANMSLSVFRFDSTASVNQATIASYLWLSSEISGPIESPGYYLYDNGKEVEQATDNLMLTNGWRRFKWESAEQNKMPAFRYAPEYNGQLITGKVIDTRTEQPAAHIQAFLSIPGIRFRFYVAESDSNGLVQFDVKNYYGSGELILQTNTLKDSFYRVEVLSPFSESYSAPAASPFALSKNSRALLEKTNIGMQVQNTFSADSIKKFYLPGITDTLPFYGKPTNTYMLDDYVRFTTMEEVLREYVREINVGARGGKLHVKMLNEDEKEYFENDALVLIDGVPLLDRDKLFSYDPLKVKRLDVIPKTYIAGPSSFIGVASFTTYEGNLDGFELDPHAIALDYEGLQLQREFYAPVYETNQQLKSRIPDFRNTLFWSPGIITNEKGQASTGFYTSDAKGRYTVLIQGIDSNGNAAAATMTLEVGNE